MLEGITICSKLEELICKNCVFWAFTNMKDNDDEFESEGICSTSKPPWDYTLGSDSCGDGYWLCEHWSSNEDKYPVAVSYLRKDFLTKMDFLESKLNEEKRRSYLERQATEREQYAKEWTPKTTKGKFEHLDQIVKTFSDDIYAIKEKLGLNY